MPRKPLESFELTQTFAASPRQIFEAWLHPVGHGRFTGGAEAIVTDKVGEMYSCWDGYIEGTNLELESPHRIVQSWRTADFGGTDRDSRLELVLESQGTGTRLILRHSELPAGSGDTYRQGWEDHYFVHMREVLG